MPLYLRLIIHTPESLSVASGSRFALRLEEDSWLSPPIY
jgi:hypothetical protein